eukprot:523985-Pyramimonas_sp.AAC.1
MNNEKGLTGLVLLRQPVEETCIEPQMVKTPCQPEVRQTPENNTCESSSKLKKCNVCEQHPAERLHRKR